MALLISQEESKEGPVDGKHSYNQCAWNKSASEQVHSVVVDDRLYEFSCNNLQIFVVH